MHIGWIDFSKGDKDKVLTVLQLFAEKGAIDELGIGSVRDAFSNFFFPGTSTIQTRAKYFFIVSYLLQEAATGNKGFDWLWQQEKTCCKLLVDKAQELNQSLIGIIGNTEVASNKWIKRKPSSIYWNGIKTLGFFNRSFQDLSMAEYFHQAGLIAKEKENLKKSSQRTNQEGDDADDEITLGSSFRKFWEIKPSKDWLQNLRIELNAQEAAFFADTLQKHYPESVFNILLKHWDKEKEDKLTFGAIVDLVRRYADQETQQMLQYALEFDRLVYSARVAYNVVLSDGANSKATREWEKQLPQLQEIAKIDLKEIFLRLNLQKPSTLHFLENLVKLFSEDTVDFNSIKKLLISREKSLKGARAKLTRPSTENKDWIGGGHLEYRTPNVIQLIKDIKHYV